MIEHSVQIRVDRPVEEVYAFLTDTTNHPRWDSSSLSMQPDEPGPWKAGLTFHEVRQMGPRRMEVRSKVRAIVPNESLDIDSLTGPEFHGHWRLSPDGSGTIIRWSCELAVTGPARLAQRLIAGKFRAGTDESFARLKAVLEGADGGITP